MIDELDVEQMMKKFLDDMDPLNNDTEREEARHPSGPTLLAEVREQANSYSDSIDTNDAVVALDDSDCDKDNSLLRTSSRGKGSSSKKEEDDVQVASKPLTRRQRKKLEQQELLRESIRVREESQIICKMEREHKRPGEDSKDESSEPQTTAVQKNQIEPPGDDRNELKCAFESIEMSKRDTMCYSTISSVNVDDSNLKPTEVFQKSPSPGIETSTKDVMKVEMDSQHTDCSLFKGIMDSSIIDDIVSQCILDNSEKNSIFESQRLFLNDLASPAESTSDVSDATLSDLSLVNNVLSIDTLCKLLESERTSEISLEAAEASVYNGLKKLQAISDNFYSCLNRTRHIVLHK